MTKHSIRLVISDIDGTLVRHDKSLPQENIAAIQLLVERGVAVSLISARPAAGIQPIAAQLGLAGPFGAFNGGTIFDSDGTEREEHRVPQGLAASLLALYTEAGLTRWVFTADRWLTSNAANPHTAREIVSSGLQPEAASDFSPVLDKVSKLVAVCDDPVLMGRIEQAGRALVGDRASLVRSQDYYLDATALTANKGDGIDRLARCFGVPLTAVAVIGDQANDVAMFRRAGLSIAMGQASDAVKHEASQVAASNEDGGVADAISRYILPRI